MFDRCLRLDEAIRAIDYFSQSETIVVDTETYGLRPYHGDRIFAIQLFDGKKAAYFNFHEYRNPEYPVLPRSFIMDLEEKLFSLEKTWIGHNLKFDMHMLNVEGIELKGSLHDTMIVERLLSYTCDSFSLSQTALRYGSNKDDGVEKWFSKNKKIGQSVFHVEHKDRPIENRHYDRVPPEIMIPYGYQDVISTWEVYQGQLLKFPRMQSLIRSNTIKFQDLYEQEMALLRVVFDMERSGVKIDRKYIKDAIQELSQKQIELCMQFHEITGEFFDGTPSQKKRVLASIEEQWKYGKPTQKGTVNPKFDKKTLSKLESPVAELIKVINSTKYDLKVFQSYLYHANDKDTIHASFDQHYPVTGRFSSSNPNLQNIKKPDKDDVNFENTLFARRAFIPRPDRKYLMMDYSQMEYVLVTEYAQPQAVIEKLLNNEDYHQITATIAGIPRKKAKGVNFGLIYGMGDGSLAENLGISIAEASSLRQKILGEIPEIGQFLSSVKTNLSVYGNIFTWKGRVFEMPDRSTHYKGPNALIQGGCADIVKAAMVAFNMHVNENRAYYFTKYMFVPYMVMQIHDEFIFEVSVDFSDEDIRIIKQVLEKVYPYKKVPMRVGVDVGVNNLADKVEIM